VLKQHHGERAHRWFHPEPPLQRLLNNAELGTVRPHLPRRGNRRLLHLIRLQRTIFAQSAFSDFKKCVRWPIPWTQKSIHYCTELLIGTVVKPPETPNGTVVNPPKPAIGTVVKSPETLNGTVVNPPKSPNGTDAPTPYPRKQYSRYVLSQLCPRINDFAPPPPRGIAFAPRPIPKINE
jgi:hypothetical protein